MRENLPANLSSTFLPPFRSGAALTEALEDERGGGGLAHTYSRRSIEIPGRDGRWESLGITAL